MTDSEAILKELEKQGKRLSSIESTIQSIAVQDNKIITLQEQVHDLYSKYNDTFGPEGVISNITKFQASCPRQQMKWTWRAIALIATAELGFFGVLFAMIAKMGG